MKEYLECQGCSVFLLSSKNATIRAHYAKCPGRTTQASNGKKGNADGELKFLLKSFPDFKLTLERLVKDDLKKLGVVQAQERDLQSEPLPKQPAKKRGKRLKKRKRSLDPEFRSSTASLEIGISEMVESEPDQEKKNEIEDPIRPPVCRTRKTANTLFCTRRTNKITFSQIIQSMTTNSRKPLSYPRIGESGPKSSKAGEDHNGDLDDTILDPIETEGRKTRVSSLKARAKLKAALLDKEESEKEEEEIDLAFGRPKPRRRLTNDSKDSDFRESDVEEVESECGTVASPSSLTPNEELLKVTEPEIDGKREKDNERTLCGRGRKFRKVQFDGEELPSYCDLAGRVKIECPKCRKYVAQSHLKAHLELHKRKGLNFGTNQENPIPCLLCSERFRKHCTLKAHFVRSHMKNSPYICRFPGCGMKMGDFFHLESHVFSHVEEFGMECEECGGTFNRVDKLAKHQKICKGIDKRFVKTKKGKIPQFSVHNKVSILAFKALLEENERNEYLAEVSEQITPRVVEIESVHLVDSAVKSENRKDENTDIKSSFVKTDNFCGGDVKSESENSPSLRTVSTEAQDCCQENGNDSVAEPEPSWDFGTIYKPGTTIKDCNEISMGEIRTIILQFLLSFNKNLRNASYINSLIREDPLYQKLEKENPDFAQSILRTKKGVRSDSDYKTSQEKLFECGMCGQGFKRYYKLEIHQNSNSGICSKIKEKPKDSQSSTSPSKLELTCGSCGFIGDSESMRKHKKDGCKAYNKEYHEKRKFQCKIQGCGAWFTGEDTLNLHVERIHQAEKKFKCDECGKAFTLEKRLQAHRLRVHQCLNYKYKCSTCNRKFQVEKVFRKHEKMCRINVCSQCGETFSYRHSLKNHVMRVHGKGGDVKAITVSETAVREAGSESGESIGEVNTDATVILGL